MPAIRNPQSAIHHPSRRDFVRIGGLTALGLALPQLATAAPTAKAKKAILIWLDGGPSHLETFDVKPAAPREVRGPLVPIDTNVPGIQVSECLPKLAQRMQHAAIVRSVTSPLGEHNLGTHYLMTGYPPTPALEYPAIGSVVAHLDRAERTLPRHIAVPNFGVGGRRYSGNGYLPESTRPFAVGGDPARPDFRVAGLDYYPGIAGERIDRRREYLQRLESFSRGIESSAEQVPTAFEQAYRLVSSPTAKAAFDLAKEPAAIRAKYGPRSIGQSTLLARRLIEADVPF